MCMQWNAFTVALISLIVALVGLSACLSLSCGDGGGGAPG